MNIEILDDIEEFDDFCDPKLYTFCFIAICSVVDLRMSHIYRLSGDALTGLIRDRQLLCLKNRRSAWGSANSGGWATLQGTNIYPFKVAGNMIFLLYRWDMLVFWRLQFFQSSVILQLRGLKVETQRSRLQADFFQC